MNGMASSKRRGTDITFAVIVCLAMVYVFIVKPTIEWVNKNITYIIIGLVTLAGLFVYFKFIKKEDFLS